MISKECVWQAARIALAACLLSSSLGCYYVVKPVVLHNDQAKRVFAPLKPDHTVTGSAWTNSVGEGTNVITVLHFESVSNYYSFGYHHGRIFATQIRDNIDMAYGVAKSLMQRKKGLRSLPDSAKTAIINVALDKAWERMEPYVYQCEKDEMEVGSPGTELEFAL